jgi:uncharacterized protein YhfF
MRSCYATVRGATRPALLWAWERDCGGPPRIGQQHVLHDWHGTPLALLENTRVEVVPFWP